MNYVKYINIEKGSTVNTYIDAYVYVYVCVKKSIRKQF